MKTNSYSELLKILPVQSTEAIMSTLSILPLDLREFLRKKFSEEGDRTLSSLLSNFLILYFFLEPNCIVTMATVVFFRSKLLI